MDAIKERARDLMLSILKSFREPAVLLRQNEDGTYSAVFVTEAFAELMECQSEQAKTMMDTGLASTVHAEDRIFVRRMLRRHVNEEGGADLVVRLTTARNTVIWCTVHYSFITEFTELYVYCTYRNITMLKEYEERLRTAYTNLGDNFYQADEGTLGLFRVNLSRDIIEDMQGRELFGTDSTITPYSVVLGKRAESLELPQERENFIETFDPDELIVGYLKGKAQVALTVFSRRPDGQCRYVTMKATTTRHPMTGDIIAFLSENEANQTKVQETLLSRILSRHFDMVAWLSEGRYGVVIGDAARIEKGSIFPLSRQGTYLSYLTSQVQPVLAGSEQECLEMFTALLPETVRKNLNPANPYMVNIVVKVDGEIWYKRFDFYTVDQNSKFCIVLKSDTTDLQREQIRINDQLKLALAEAQQASVAKTAFLSRMSHEIRTPMNAIIGLDTLALREKEISPALQNYLSKIGSSARYLLSLINDILDMSRIESGRMVLKNEEFSFANFLDLVNTLVDGQCQERGLSYECQVKGQVREYYIGDDTKLRQILINLLGNAVKFTNTGGKVSMTVEQSSNLEHMATFRFTIADTGIGMEASFLPKLFEPFSQEDSSTTSKYGGSGLGLAITKNMLTLMNGQIEVSSQKGRGTTFYVTVPLKEVEKDLSLKTSLALEASELHVLIIDDDPLSLEHAKAVLEEIGVSSETCASGAEALELIKTNHARRQDFNLILVDLRMPEHDGIEVTRDIRKLLGHETAIIIITAYSWTEVEEEARSAGVDGFIAKPIFVANVLEEFHRAISQKQRHQKEQEETEVSLAGKNILLAEDVPLNAEIIMQLLDLLELKVEHVENGAKALENFQNSAPFHYAAILMDVRMPVMDGLSATRQIRALKRPDAASIPIIAMTANAFDEDVQNSLQAGMNAHLTKPVDPENLTKTLTQLIGRFAKDLA